jgi:hypothetical protein
MSTKKLITQLLEQIQKNPSLPVLAEKMEEILKEQQIVWERYKKWSTIIVLILSVTYNILKTIGIW